MGEHHVAEQSESEQFADAVVSFMHVAGADRGYRSLDVFSTWVAAGTAAALGLAVANLNELQGFVALADIKAGAPWLLGAFALVLFSKLLGSVICTTAGSMQAAFSVQEQIVKNGGSMPSPSEFSAALHRGRPWPLRIGPRFDVRTPSAVGRRTLWLLMLSSASAIIAVGLILRFWFLVFASI